MNLDRARGALVGLAVGDALGAPVEFKRPGSFPPVVGYKSGGPHGLNAGEWTDDTSMALALADSINNMGWNLSDQMERYTQWLEEGKYSVNGWCFDIGCTTRSAIENYMRSKNAHTSGATEASASGNGGIMRIAPVAIRYTYCEEYKDAPTEELLRLLFKLGVDSSITTHASEMCKSAAGYMTVVLSKLILGQSREEALSYDPEIGKLLHPEVDKVAKGSFRTKSPAPHDKWWPDERGFIKGSGFVVDSLEAALWAFYHASSFSEAVLSAVNLGEDSDTTGAVCGQFAGAFWGESGIPEDWRKGLAKFEMIDVALKGLTKYYVQHGSD
jgi:ADP-ribosylglycohydrolase